MNAVKENTRDQHSPANFQPEQYTEIGVFYQGGSDEMDRAINTDPSSIVAWKAIEDSSYKGNHAHKGTCDHCGASFAYGIAFKHIDGDVIAVGHICANEAFGCNDRRNYDRKCLVNRAKAYRENLRIKSDVARILESDTELAEALNVDHYITKDIKGFLNSTGRISDKQRDLVIKIQGDVAKREEDKANEPEPVAIPSEIDGTRAVITGVVLGVKYKESQFGGCYKILVLDDRGFKVWGSVPSAIDMNELRGARVTFTGKVQISDDDKCFGFFNRPSKAERL